MEPSILLLPAELKRHIVELSSGSPNSLAALARTHTAYRSEAEKVLYGTLSISASSEDSLKCMETLAKNSEKAALVRFLTVEYSPRIITKRTRKVTNCLRKSLINMRSLSDFRIILRRGEIMGKKINSLVKILCKRHFRLQTFYCDNIFIISRIVKIIKSQTELQILGLYTPDSLGDVLKTLKELHNAQLFLPIVLTLDRDSSLLSPNHIGIFPAFYSVDRRATIHRVLAQSFCKDQDNYTLANVRRLSIYLIDSSDMPSIYELAKDMAVSLPQIGWLNLFFEHRCEIPPREIEEKFSFFSNLYEVKIDVWPTA